MDSTTATFARGSVACVVCGKWVDRADELATTVVPSRSEEYKYFVTHVVCFRNAILPEVARFLPLDDVVTGLGPVTYVMKEAKRGSP